jgi:hypothetical protein
VHARPSDSYHGGSLGKLAPQEARRPMNDRQDRETGSCSRSFVMKRIASLAMVALIGVGVMGCSSDKKEEPKAAMGLMNSKCPLMPDHPIDPNVTADYKGGKVGFCCDGCLPDWNKMTDAQKDERLAKAK